MKTIFTPNKTSAKLLVDYAEREWNQEDGSPTPEQRRHYLLVYDLYIKARSYAIINKLAFWGSIVGGLLVLAWPSITVLSERFGYGFLTTAIVQTTITGLAALMFSIYRHYKTRQNHLEILMRRIVLSPDGAGWDLELVLGELERLDVGFNFSDHAAKDGGETKGPSQ